MFIFFLKKLRKLFRSLGKVESKIVDKLVQLEDTSKIKFNKALLKDSDFTNWSFILKQKKNYPKKLVIVICFYFNKKKINILKKTIKKISQYRFKIDLTLVTNKVSNSQKKILDKLGKPRLKKINIHQIIELPENNLLPWFSINVMKKKFINKSNSHFMFLEDDILVSNENICYWVYFRKILKKIKLVPGFLRCENYKKNLYVVDNPKKITLFKNPKILTASHDFGFINSKYPYSGMYLMDREMMKEYLNSSATEVDFSFTNSFMKSSYPIKELLNISHAYFNVPRGFYNKLMIPFNTNGEIPNYCVVEHSDVKYANSTKLQNMGFGKIKLKDLIRKN